MKQEVDILGGQRIDRMLRVWLVGAQASKFGFYNLKICIIKKKMSWCKTEMQKYMPLVKRNVKKFEVFILGVQRIDQKINKGWWRESSEKIEMEAERG